MESIHLTNPFVTVSFRAEYDDSVDKVNNANQAINNRINNYLNHIDNLAYYDVQIEHLQDIDNVDGNYIRNALIANVYLHTNGISHLMV